MNNKLFLALTTTALAAHGTVCAEPTWELTGAVEAELAVGDNSSDITAATVELGIGAQINEQVTSDIVLLHEEDDTPLEVDVATITLAPNDNWRITTGQSYVPFGVYDSHMISDPLTLEIGETRESVLQADLLLGDAMLTGYVFNGTNQDNASKDEADRYGLNLRYAMQNDSVGFSGAIGYISDIGESDAIEATLATNLVKDYIGGLSVSAAVSSGPVSVIAEYIAAVDAFQATELAHNGKGAQPKATNLELGYAMGATTLAIGLQKTEEASALDLPEQRMLASVSKEIMTNTALALEWAGDKDYANNSSDTYTVQLAVAF